MQLCLRSLFLIICSLFLVRPTCAGFTGDQWNTLSSAANSLRQLNVDFHCAELVFQAPFLPARTKDQIYDTCHTGRIRSEFLSGVPSNPMNPPLVTVPKGTSLFFPTMSIIQSLDLSRPTWFYSSPNDAFAVAAMMFHGRGVTLGDWPEMWEVVTNEEIPLLAIQSGKDGFLNAIQKLPFTQLPKAMALRSKKQSETRTLGKPASVALALVKDLDLCTAVQGWRNPANMNEVVLCPSALQKVTVKPAVSLLKKLREALHYDELRTDYLEAKKHVEDHKLKPSDRERIDKFNALVVKHARYFTGAFKDTILEELLTWFGKQQTPRIILNDFFMAYTRQLIKAFPDRDLVAEKWSNDRGAFLLADLPIDVLQKIL